MTTTQSPSKAEKTIKAWISSNLAEELTDLEIIQILAFNLPTGTGRASSSKVNSIDSVQLKDFDLITPGYAKVMATITITASVSLIFYWEDYQQSEDVRDLVGESEEFAFTHIDAIADFKLQIEFELLDEPPLVASHRVLEVKGDHGVCTFKS